MKSMYLYLTPKNVSTTVYKGLQKDTCVPGCYMGCERRDTVVWTAKRPWPGGRRMGGVKSEGMAYLVLTSRLIRSSTRCWRTLIHSKMAPAACQDLNLSAYLRCWPYQSGCWCSISGVGTTEVISVAETLLVGVPSDTLLWHYFLWMGLDPTQWTNLSKLASSCIFQYRSLYKISLVTCMF